jgi:hypothetical protein
MTFEEFFKKKKINLQTFEQGESALFFEFKTHYEQMGEKSFDHTKKYWFNKLRFRFPAPIEAKAEKVAIENPLAEQTITESLIESAPALPSVGFKPKFRAGATKPAEPASPSTEDAKATISPQTPAENAEPATSTPPNIGFKPKFRAGVTKPAEPTSSSTQDAKPVATPQTPAENTEEAPAPTQLGFKPKFRAGVTKTAEPAIEQKDEPNVEETPAPKQSTDDKEAKPAYKPRFNMKNIKPKEEE